MMHPLRRSRFDIAHLLVRTSVLYVLSYDGAAWSLEQTFNGSFGDSVAVSGNFIVANANDGVHVLHRDTTQWTDIQTLAVGAGVNGLGGVAIVGDRLAAGRKGYSVTVFDWDGLT